MGSRLPSAVLVVLLAAWLCPPGFCVTPAEAKSRIIADWAALRPESKGTRVQTTIDFFGAPLGRELWLNQHDVIGVTFSPAGFLSSYESEILNEQSVITERRNWLQIRNSKYIATMQHAKNKDVWLLTEYKDNERDNGVADRGDVLVPWRRCGNYPLPDWIADDCFGIERVEELDNIWRVHFAHDEAKRKSLPKDYRLPKIAGWIDFDPASHYRVLGYRFAIKSKFSEGVETGVLTYGPSLGDIPILRKMQSDMESKSEDGRAHHSRVVYTYEANYNATVPDEEFRLSHYGLPEPVGVKWKKRTPTYVWILTAAGVCGLFAVSFRVLARRRREPVT